MSASLEFEGLRELKDALQRLPQDLVAEATAPVEKATREAAAELQAAYPTHEGAMRRGVKTTIDKSAFGVFGQVRSTSKHAIFWEFGTQNRRTKQGWNRGRAPSHAREGLIPIAQRKRRRMYEELKDILKRAGFDLT